MQRRQYIIFLIPPGPAGFGTIFKSPKRLSDLLLWFQEAFLELGAFLLSQKQAETLYFFSPQKGNQRIEEKTSTFIQKY
jgi:hypothetical protein